MSDFQPEHRCLTRTIRVARPIDVVFPLLTPEGERLWVTNWAPVYLSGHADRETAGTVFLTEHQNENTVWTVAEIDRERHHSRYIRHTEGSRTAMVSIDCRSVEGGTSVEVTYDVTGLTVSGNAAVLGFEKTFPGAIDDWARLIEATIPLESKKKLARLPVLQQT